MRSSLCYFRSFVVPIFYLSCDIFQRKSRFPRDSALCNFHSVFSPTESGLSFAVMQQHPASNSPLTTEREIKTAYHAKVNSKRNLYNRCLIPDCFHAFKSFLVVKCSHIFISYKIIFVLVHGYQHIMLRYTNGQKFFSTTCLRSNLKQLL